jgi:hypothetical protein
VVLARLSADPTVVKNAIATAISNALNVKKMGKSI